VVHLAVLVPVAVHKVLDEFGVGWGGSPGLDTKQNGLAMPVVWACGLAEFIPIHLSIRRHERRPIVVIIALKNGHRLLHARLVVHALNVYLEPRDDNILVLELGDNVRGQRHVRQRGPEYFGVSRFHLGRPDLEE